MVKYRTWGKSAFPLNFVGNVPAALSAGLTFFCSGIKRQAPVNIIVFALKVAGSATAVLASVLQVVSATRVITVTVPIADATACIIF